MSRYVCKRRACARPRNKWEYFCSSCWAGIPGRFQARIVQAGKAKHFLERDQLRADAEAFLDGKRPLPGASISAAAADPMGAA